MFPTLLYALGVVAFAESYRILGVFPFNGKSHFVMYEPLMKGLALKGHQVDVISHFPLKNPPKNYRDIVDLQGSMEQLVNNYTMDLVQGIMKNPVPFIAENYGNRLCHLMGLPEMQDLIRNPPIDPPYDIVIVEAFTANCYFGLGHRLGVPTIAVTSAIDHPWMNDFTGNCDNLAVFSSIPWTAGKRMSLWERLQNIAFYYMILWQFQSFTDQSQTESMKKYLGPDAPSVREAERSIALTLVNTHPVISGIKPITPGLVQVGGLHVLDDEQPISKDLEKWMNESNDGVVYFTLGSMVVIESMPTEKILEIYSSFRKIAPIRILMKVANEELLPPGLPKNVRTLPWIPQKAILKHPKTRVFITHCGLMGLQEALYYGVPTIGIPLFADQYYNAEIFKAKNMMFTIKYDELSEKILDEALQQVLYNPIYRDSSQLNSRLFKDNPSTSLNTAIFWIEYIARNGPNVLRSPALDMSWWEVAKLDIYALSLVIVALILLIFFKLLKLIVRSNKKLATCDKKEKYH